MREQWARRIALLTGVLVLLLAIIFAIIQNPPVTTDDTASAPPSAEPASITPDPQQVEAGRHIYQQQGCARCHSIAGTGNRRNPLDGVGARRTAVELNNWIIGAEAVREKISASVVKLKQGYRELPESDRDTLVIYLQSLQED